MRSLLVGFSLLWLAAPCLSADDLTVLPSQIGGVAPSEVVAAYLRKLAHEALDRRQSLYEELKTEEQLAAYQGRMRQLFIRQLGGFPERTPLNARVVGRQDRDGYRIEKIIYESRPGLFVTAVLYLPNADPPHPGVLVPCGHSQNGKAAEAYQRASILLAKNGIAALCYDPIGQGERSQLLDADGQSRFRSTLEHTLVGVGSILLGMNTARYRIWDGMRGIDYLVSRKEIDPDRIGCTGNSGGGTLTSYIMALDERVACAAPSCYLTTLRRIVDTIGPQDAEQNIYAQVARGMEHGDYVIMRAPRPTLMCVATRDFFDIDGAWHTFREAKRFYTRLESSERVGLVETDATHGFSTQLRVGMVRWMRRWLLEIDDAVDEADFPILTDQEVQCTSQGQVLLMPGARSVFDLNAELEKRLEKERRKFWNQTSKPQALQRVREITGVLKLAELPAAKYDELGSIERKSYHIKKLVLRQEEGIWLPALAFVPARRSGEAYLYLHGEGKHADAAPGGPIEQLVEAGHLVLAADLRGIGETESARSRSGWNEHFGGGWKDFFLAYLLGKSYVGMRADDVLACARFLAEYRDSSRTPHSEGEDPARQSDGRGGSTPSVHLVAIGEAGPPALHAVALEPELFESLKLERSLISWSNVVHTPVTRNQLINTVHGALRTYDLPDLIATLPAGKVEVVEPLDAAGQPVQK